MKNHVLIEYMFMFEADVFGQILEFEKTFTAYLESIGLQGEAVPLIGGANKRLVLIKKKPVLEEVATETKPRTLAQTKPKSSVGETVRRE